MSEETTMYEELSLWRDRIDLMMQLAIEMESHEQVSLDDTIAHLFNSTDDDERYCIDFEYPGDSERKLVFEFRAYEKSEEGEP